MLKWASQAWATSHYSYCGGALMAALTDVPELWQEGNLKCVHRLQDL